MSDRPDAQTEAVVVEFTDKDDPQFAKPDHDPHGEVPALAAHSGTWCDSCGTHGLVPTAACDDAMIRDVDLVCSSTVLCFQETTENVISVLDLAPRIAPGKKTNETVVHLHHSTLPRLTNAGLFEYDSRSETVRYYPESDAEELLDVVTDCFPKEEQFCEVAP